MTVSFTCSRHLDPGANTTVSYNTTSRPLHSTSLATPPATAKHGQPYLVHSTSPDLSFQHGSPDLQAMSNLKTTVNIAEITVDADSTPPKGRPIKPSMEFGSNLPTNHPGHETPPSSGPSSRRTPKRKRTVSPPSPSGKPAGDHGRSASRSTQRSAVTSRRSSLHSHRRVATNASLTPSMSAQDPEIRREDLLALHRESCRLFQDHGLAVSTQHKPSPSSSAPQSPPRTIRASSEIGSAPVSPILPTRASVSSRGGRVPPLRTNSVPTTTYEEHCISPIQTSATVIDWTSPSTRRREYEKIDRASSGVRGLWRRVAPQWCQFGDSRMPFFEEGKDGKGNYEGSVRRFRMDLPDEPGVENKRGPMKALKLKRRFTVGRRDRR
ncbi:predicted protein [Aspergillus terreus NIH2624]|uniref:Uncharacterized protein n=1 Tax=Aspergillus terreus (strain NIH 2624 / FGSC A1156) TaxID=341663 RepID=Q0C9G1_ASPTN|nr:uncharacterized protein ATEG_09673 [Aspergillus terreus NIH2624]EAU29864.1 predicted protein [Aspergillus terreus NIH2624]